MVNIVYKLQEMEVNKPVWNLVVFSLILAGLTQTVQSLDLGKHSSLISTPLIGP